MVKDPQQPSLLQLAESLPPELENAVRTIKYTFPEEFLRYKIVRTSCVHVTDAQSRLDRACAADDLSLARGSSRGEQGWPDGLRLELLLSVRCDQGISPAVTCRSR